MVSPLKVPAGAEKALTCLHYIQKHPAELLATYNICIQIKDQSETLRLTLSPVKTRNFALDFITDIL